MKRWSRRGYTDGPYGQIHYRHEGAVTQTRGAIVLLHQAPMTSAQYDNVLRPLAAHGFHAIAIDMPGFGMSDPVPGVPRVEDWAAVVVPVLDALGYPDAVVLGHHTGAMVATEVGIQFPDRVRAVILNGPMPVSEEERAEFMEGLHQTERTITATDDGTQFNMVHAARTGLAEGTVAPARISEYVVQAFEGQGAYWHGHHAAFLYRQDETLGRLERPALILTNTGDVIYEHALAAHAIRPDFAFTALEGGGVDVVDQMPEDWAEAVTRYVSGL
ncbi:alpha/beta fold hydrolase [Novosphingobium sp. MBES04]|uniref:alpha/beta fold hydrolase n=1 Tax=Novosphingobium sp. MBES04 TaxID=1206458 RepID=UPI00057E9CE5|nr:alpha/beta fold hydrolase [Novosphingobium sp. MBES04]GAM06613.1 hydrolase or acyltransferase of alpha/beta superfamily [Novosphingobium sp. MBES04]